MKLIRALLLGLLLGLALLSLGGCRKLTTVGVIRLIYYPHEPRVCPEGIYVSLDLPADARVLSVVYRRHNVADDEIVPMLDSTSFLMTKPPKSPATPDEAEADVTSWDGFYGVGIQLTDGTVGLNFYCQGSGRTTNEHSAVSLQTLWSFVIVEDPNRDSGIEVRPTNR